MNPLSQLLIGITTPFSAIALIFRNPRLLLWCCLPFLISLLVYGFMWGSILSPLRDSIESDLNGWFSGLLGHGQAATMGSAAAWIVGQLVGIFFFIVMIFSFAWVANLIALPVNDFVAQSTERSLAPPLTRPEANGWGEEIRLIWIDFKKSIIALLGLLICLSIAWVPIINILAIVIAWLLLTYQFVSYPQTRRAIGARRGFVELFRNLPLCIGFGMGISLGLTIPIISIFVPTIGVVGGTVLFSRMKQPSI
jgi:uncharacterized protein involved in cysteine biosynthesis